MRSGVGVCDLTTLGKIDVQGAHAGEFLNRLYSNMMATLKIGRVRYGLMLREDGFAYDNGTCARLAEDHVVVTTTMANAGLVCRNMEFVRQCLWLELDVQLISTTDAWAQIAVAGPKSRALLARIVDRFDLSSEVFPFMAGAALTVCGGLRARLFRISFSGELAYEIAVPARYGYALMERLMEPGAHLGATPYGTEALRVLRIEKGHAVGAELNGQTTAAMGGLGSMVSRKKDSVGAVMSRREGLAGDKRRLVGLQPLDPAGRWSAARIFLPRTRRGVSIPIRVDHVGLLQPACGSMIGLSFLEKGDERLGDVIVAANSIEGESAHLRVVPAHFVDPEGARLRE